MTFKPMLAEVANLETLRYPLYASIKLDGVRAIVMNGVLMSRKLKPIPNKHLQAWVKAHADALEGMDGELVAGEIEHPRVFQYTTSIVMSENKQVDNVTFFVFDLINMYAPYSDRYEKLKQATLPETAEELKNPRLAVLVQHNIENVSDLLSMEQIMVGLGHEGIMTRDPNAPYKHGRATAKQQWLLKIKRFEDSEGVIVDLEEQTANDNPAKTNALGRTERSSHKAGLRPTGTLGTLVLKDVKHRGWIVRVGTGLSNEQRDEIWNNKEKYLNRLVKYKFQRAGMKDLPRFPSFVGFRDEQDT